VQSRADAGFTIVVGPALDVLPNGQAAPPVIEIPARLVETDDVARQWRSRPSSSSTRTVSSVTA
jgi:hypothetical protein